MKLYTWERKLKQHYASKNLQSRPQDIESMLGMLNNAMPPKKRSRRVVFWLISLCLLGGIGTYLVANYDSASFSMNGLSNQSENGSEGQTDSLLSDPGDFDSLAKTKQLRHRLEKAERGTKEKSVHDIAEQKHRRMLDSNVGEIAENRRSKTFVALKDQSNNQEGIAQGFKGGLLKNGSETDLTGSREDEMAFERNVSENTIPLEEEASSAVLTTEESTTSIVNTIRSVVGASKEDIDTISTGTAYRENVLTGTLTNRSELELQSGKGGDVSVDRALTNGAILLVDTQTNTSDGEVQAASDVKIDFTSSTFIDSFERISEVDSLADGDSLVTNNTIKHVDSRTVSTKAPRSISVVPLKSFRWEASGVGSYFLSQQQLSFTSPGESDYFRRDYEKPLSSQSFGLGFAGILKNHYLVSTGYRQHTLLDETDYPDIETISLQARTITHLTPFERIGSIDSFYVQLDDKTTLVIDTQYIKGFDTSYSQVIDTTEVAYQFNREQVKSNYHQIPLTLGYRFYYHRWSFDVLSGLQLNVLGRTQGNYYVLDEDHPTAIDRSQLKKFMLGGVFRVEAGFRIRTHWKLKSGLSYSSMPNILASSISTEQRYSFIGFRMGMGYTF